MKKLLVIVSLLLILFSFFSYNKTGLISGTNTSLNSYGVYACLNEDTNIFNKKQNLGFINEIFNCTPTKFYSFNLNGEVVGEFFETTTENFNLQEFAHNFGLAVIKTSQVGNISNIYARSALLPYKIKGQEYNLQISINNSIVTVASPIIMGAY